jgi:hypothetical protein
LTASAPRPVSDSGRAAGGRGADNLRQAIQSVARAGTSMLPASACPTSRRRAAGHASASSTSVLTEAPSRKSMESANSETEPMESATRNSMPK